MKHGESSQSPREQEHARLADDLRVARAKRLKKAVASSGEDPREVQKKLDALEIELHRVIDVSEATFRTPAEEMRTVAKDTLLEILRGTQSDLEQNGSRLLRDDDWKPYIDGIVERSAKIAPAEVVDAAEFRFELLGDPEVAEVIQSLKRLSAEHARTQISNVMDEYVQELRDKVKETAFLYKGAREIAEDISDQVAHVIKRIGLKDKGIAKEYQAWGERQATEIMLKRIQHIFDIAVRTAYEQDPNLSDPQHLREAVRHMVNREKWEDFDFDGAFDGYTQSDEFLDEYRQRFLDTITNEPLRNDIETLLNVEQPTVAFHQLAENIEVYLHAFSGQSMKQLAFLVGILFERWLARPGESFNVIDDVRLHKKNFSRRFGEDVSMKQCIEDINTLVKWDGAFDPLVERFTTEALRPFMGRRLKIAVPKEYNHTKLGSFEETVPPHIPFFELNQMFTSAHSRILTVEHKTTYEDHMGIEIQEEQELVPKTVHGDHKRQMRIMGQALQELKEGKIPRRLTEYSPTFVKYYMQQEMREAITTLREGRSLPNGRKPKEFLSNLEYIVNVMGKRNYEWWRDDYFFRNVKILQKQRELLEFMQDRQERREQHGIE